MTKKIIYNMKMAEVQKALLKLMAEGYGKTMTRYIIDLIRKDALNLLGLPEGAFINDADLLYEVAELVKREDVLHEFREFLEGHSEAEDD